MPGKFLLFILTAICVLLMLLSFGSSVISAPLNSIVGYCVVPVQRGIETTGSWMRNRSDELVQIRSLLEENAMLKEQVAALTEENTLLQQDKYELNELRELMELDKQYESYHKVGARIISRDSGNWYSGFIVDKGKKDGIAVDMNVISGGGLVGRVSAVGPNWARVTSIISDNTNVSAMTLATQDNMIVSGDLKLMRQGVIGFSQMIDSRDAVTIGDKVVTSDISDKYLPNILIGHLHTINRDKNNLTKSGYITPVVDFEHLSEVLIITDMKQQVNEEE